MKHPLDYLRGHKAYDLSGHLELVRSLHERYPLNSTEACEAHTQELLDDALPPYLRSVVEGFIDRLYTDNEIYLPVAPALQDRDYLTTMQRRLTDPDLINRADLAVLKILRDIVRSLPSDNGLARLPLYDFCNIWPVLQYVDPLIFPDTATLHYRNAVRASGFDPKTYDGKRQLTMPFDAKGTTGQIIHEYLNLSPFRRLFETPVPFAISIDNWKEHGFIFAKSGHGKTQTLRAITASLLDKDCSLFLIDGLGSLIENVDRVESIQDRLVVIDCAAEEPPNLNLFKLGSDDLYFYLFKAIDQSFTQRQSTMISYLMELMAQLPDPTLADLIDLCEARDGTKYQAIIGTLTPFAQSFFANQFFGKKVDQLVQQTKNQIAARLYTLGRLPKFDRMLSAPSNDFDAFRFMQEKKIVVINTDARAPKHGGLGEASGIIGRFMLAQILDAARARPKDERHLSLVVLDEAKHYLDDHTSLILSDARQYGLGMLLATQFPDQLQDGVRKEVINNTSVKMCGPAAYSVVAQVQRDMRCDSDFILSMKKQDYEYAEWACYVDNMTSQAVRLTVPFGAIEKLPMVPARPKAGPPPPAPPRPPEPATVHQSDARVSDIELVITVARRLETMLEAICGATGKGLHEKLTSIEDRLPPSVMHSARYVASNRNAIVHVEGAALQDRDRFIRYARMVEDHLKQHSAEPSDLPRDTEY